MYTNIGHIKIIDIQFIYCYLFYFCNLYWNNFKVVKYSTFPLFFALKNSKFEYFILNILLSFF